MTIIKIEPLESGGHTIESQSHRTENWMGEEWIEVPPHLEADAWNCCGYCTLDIQDGKLIGLTPIERPPEPEPEPAAEEDLAGLLVDHEYRLTLLELGVGEEV